MVSFKNDPCQSTSSISSGSTDYRNGTCRTTEYVILKRSIEYLHTLIEYLCVFSVNARIREDQSKAHVPLGKNLL